MYLSGSQAHFGTLLLLVSRLLLWEGVASAPDCSTKGGSCELQDLLNHAMEVSDHLQEISAELFNNFFFLEKHSRIMDEFVEWFQSHDQDVMKAQGTCHTLPLRLPETVKEANEFTVRNFSRMLIKLVVAWKDPLYHLVNELRDMPEYPANILFRAKQAQKYNDQLFQDIKSIFLKVHPKGKIRNNFPAWTELNSLRSINRDTQFLALYKLVYCLGRDTRKMERYTMYLKCRIIQKTGC